MTPWLDDDDGPCNGVCAGCDESCHLLAVDWGRYRKCPACFAEIGRACRSLSGTVTETDGWANYGRPISTALAEPHNSRKPRSTPTPVVLRDAISAGPRGTNPTGAPA